MPSPETVLKVAPDGLITAYDPYTGTVLARFNGSQCPRNGITVIGDDQFASSHVSPETGAGSIRLYYWWSPSCKQNIPLPEPVAPLTATSDGSYLFSGGISGRIHSLILPSGDLIRSFSVHEKPISCLAINCDGSLILSGSEDGTIGVTPILLLLDSSIDTKSEIFNFIRFAGHELPVTGLTTGVGRSDGIMISSSLDWTCKVWSVVNGTHLQTVRFPGEIWCMVLDPSETELYAAGTDRMIFKRKLKVETRKQAARGGDTVVCGGMQDGAVVAIMMLNYGKTVLTVSENGGFYAWEVDSGRMISSFSEKTGGVGGVVVVKHGGGFGTRGVKGGYGSGKEVVKEVGEMEEALKVVVEDRGRAISDLELAIEINEKLLNLMLKEANAISKFETIKGT
ncbi:hypothetical protein L1987_84630 [Smallanthus sonchifolius]|uniref:Uncharacterized protein n=1 Tax=Smallanthus sonchifolius TaxID=185202 RepID=A0ACB8XUY0_9ASTR|nr:hypothetical protein L1987_84630 [Smallanthus sonchifolius]